MGNVDTHRLSDTDPSFDSDSTEFRHKRAPFRTVRGGHAERRDCDYNRSEDQTVN